MGRDERTFEFEYEEALELSQSASAMPRRSAEI